MNKNSSDEMALKKFDAIFTRHDSRLSKEQQEASLQALERIAADVRGRDNVGSQRIKSAVPASSSRSSTGLPGMHSGALMKEMTENEAPDPFTRKWLLVVILCMVPSFFLFAVMGDPGRGRAAAICLGVGMTAVRACWNLRKHIWFWIVLAVMIACQGLFIALVSWTDKSFPGYALLPVAVLDYGIVYGCFKLFEKVTKGSD